MEGAYLKKKPILKSVKELKQVKFVQKQTIINQKGLRKKVSKNQQTNRSAQRQREQQFSDSNSDKLQIIRKSFSIFCSESLEFNQFICGLKYIGISIETQQDFIIMFNIFNQNQQMTLKKYVPIALGLLNQQTQKELTNQQICLKKAYYYILQQGNELNRFSNIYDSVNDSGQQAQIFDNYKRQVQNLPKQNRFITFETLKNIRNYLNRNDISDQELQQIFLYQVDGKQSYISEENLLQMINYNKIA